MIFKGYKIRVRCLDWEQVDTIGQYWSYFTSFVKSEKLVGLGIQPLDTMYFDYALGVIDDEETLHVIQEIDFSDCTFVPVYIEVELSPFSEWETFSGKVACLTDIYDKQIDCYHRYYDYELEYIDSQGNIEIKVHYT